MDTKKAKCFIVKKLFHYGYIGGRHTDVGNLKKGLPGHFKGDIKKAAEELIKEGLLLEKHASYGKHVSLNPAKRKELEVYLE